MGRNPGKNSGGEEKQNVSQGKDEHGSAPANKRSKGGDNPTVRERNAGKTGGARRGMSRRNGSEHEKG